MTFEEWYDKNWSSNWAALDAARAAWEAAQASEHEEVVFDTYETESTIPILFDRGLK
jgi:hypothetical protein